MHIQMDASNAGNQIGTKTNIYTEINVSTASKQIILETNITETNAYSASNQIGLEINIYTKINASTISNQI